MFDQQSLRSACAYAQSDQSLCYLLEYSMSVKLLSIILIFYALKEAAQARLSLHLSKCHIVGNHVRAHIIRDQSYVILSQYELSE